MVTDGILTDRDHLSRELTEHMAAVLHVKEHVVRRIVEVIRRFIGFRPLLLLHEGGIQLLRRPALIGVAGDLGGLGAVAHGGRKGGGIVGVIGAVGRGDFFTAGGGFGGVAFGGIFSVGLPRYRGLLPCRRIGLGRAELIASATGGESRGQHKGGQNSGYDSIGFHDVLLYRFQRMSPKTWR